MYNLVKQNAQVNCSKLQGSTSDFLPISGTGLTVLEVCLQL